MDIKKAIKKQKSSFKLFMFIMSFISLMLPFLVLLTGKSNIFYMIYLIFIEILIIAAVIAMSNNECLKFKCVNNKLKIQVGIFKFTNILLCDKVSLIHTENNKENMEIVIVTDIRIRNKQIRPINKYFKKKYPLAYYEFEKIKKLNYDRNYYFIVIKKGGYLKYNLLDIIYRNCVKAIYTDESIKNIKIARGQLKIEK